MEEIDLIALLKALLKNWKSIVKWGVIGGVVGIVIGFSTPKTYESSVKMVAERKSTTQSSMSALAGLAGINMNTSTDGLSALIYPEIIKSPLFIQEFYNLMVVFDQESIPLNYYLLEEQKAPWWIHIIKGGFSVLRWGIGLLRPDQELVEGDGSYNLIAPSEDQLRFDEAFADRVSTKLDDQTGEITISVTMQDPVIAAQIADSVVTKLQRYVIHYRTEKARTDLSFAIKQLEEAKANYYKADSVYAVMADRNQNLITKRAQIRLERVQNERNINFSIYQQMATQVEVSRMKLQEQTPIATIIRPAQIPPKAAAPSKIMYMIGFGFLFGIAIVGKYTYLFIQEEEKSLEESANE